MSKAAAGVCFSDPDRDAQTGGEGAVCERKWRMWNLNGNGKAELRVRWNSVSLRVAFYVMAGEAQERSAGIRRFTHLKKILFPQAKRLCYAACAAAVRPARGQ
jgi:hypothetical protein